MKDRESVQQREQFRSQVSEISGLPKDVVYGVPILTIVGQMELTLENYRGILEYTDILIRIQSKTGQIRITGTKLQIAYYTNDEMKITGKVTGIEYL